MKRRSLPASGDPRVVGTAIFNARPSTARLPARLNTSSTLPDGTRRLTSLRTDIPPLSFTVPPPRHPTTQDPAQACTDRRKYYSECGTACPLGCDTPRIIRSCREACITGCFCQPEFIFLSAADWRNSPCVRRFRCPNTTAAALPDVADPAEAGALGKAYRIDEDPVQLQTRQHQLRLSQEQQRQEQKQIERHQQRQRQRLRQKEELQKQQQQLQQQRRQEQQRRLEQHRRQEQQHHQTQERGRERDMGGARREMEKRLHEERRAEVERRRLALGEQHIQEQSRQRTSIPSSRRPTQHHPSTTGGRRTSTTQHLSLPRRPTGMDFSLETHSSRPTTNPAHAVVTQKARKCTDPNASWQACGSACPRGCDSLYTSSRACTMNCVPGCFCNAGFVFQNESDCWVREDGGSSVMGCCCCKKKNAVGEKEVTGERPRTGSEPGTEPTEKTPPTRGTQVSDLLLDDILRTSAIAHVSKAHPTNTNTDSAFTTTKTTNQPLTIKAANTTRSSPAPSANSAITVFSAKSAPIALSSKTTPSPKP